MTNDEFGEYVKQSILSLNSNMERLVEKVDNLAAAQKTTNIQIKKLGRYTKRIANIVLAHDESIDDLDARLKRLEQKRKDNGGHIS